MFGGDFGLPPGPRYGRRSTGGAPPVAYLCHAVAPRRSPCRIVELVQRLRLPPRRRSSLRDLSSLTEKLRSNYCNTISAFYILQANRSEAGKGVYKRCVKGLIQSGSKGDVTTTLGDHS